jgi:hypothetical protein
MIGFGNSPAAEGGELGPSSDVFRLGLVLAFAATGHGPFRTGKPAALADRVVHGSPDLDRVPDEIRSLVERCLAQDPGQRPTPAGLVAEIGPARPGADWLPASITRSIAGYMLPAPAEMAWPDKSRMAPQVAALASATRPDLPATPASAESEAGQAAVAKTKPSAGRTLLTAGAVAVAAAVAVTLIVVAIAGHPGQPQAASRPAHPALAHRAPRPAPAPVHLAAWSAGQRIGQADAFAAISCPAATFCMAADSGGSVYTYSAGRWSGPQRLASGALSSVSCATASFCAATGPYGRAYVYADGRWSAPSQLTGADGNPADLKWVSCPVADFCLAAGKWDAYTYSAGQWAMGHQIQQSRTFTSISCPAATFCMAADSGGNVYTYSGGRWSGPRRIASGALSSVSCATISFCAATGTQELAYVYADGRWSAPSQLTGADGNPANLRSVSCPAAGICLAAGALDAYTYSAGTWAAGQFIQKNHIFTSISCPGATFCMAADTGGSIYTYSASLGPRSCPAAACGRPARYGVKSRGIAVVTKRFLVRCRPLCHRPLERIGVSRRGAGQRRDDLDDQEHHPEKVAGAQHDNRQRAGHPEADVAEFAGLWERHEVARRCSCSPLLRAPGARAARRGRAVKTDPGSSSMSLAVSRSCPAGLCSRDQLAPLVPWSSGQICRSRPAQYGARSVRLRTFPLGLRGSASMISTVRGHL